MRTVPDKNLPDGEIRHKSAKSRLPLNRLLEAKVLNGSRRETFVRALFPKSRAS